ncbi:MAG: patatin-like phospholipase family protein [Calditrichae bacterium]|nr:patatin-like phospholipase family protein [Calditrichia bacterium]
MLQRWAGKQPTVGLALGGGGCGGLAHVGVLEVFRRENIPVAAIAGSSMGAIVAAAYTLNPDYSETQLIDVLNEMSAPSPSI